MGGGESIASFQWHSPATLASSYLFLSCSILAYLLATISLSFLLSRFPSVVIPLGPFPALHNLILFLSSLFIFLGSLISSLSASPSWLWFFCFPPSTPPSGPVFFWSYTFYLSKYYELLDTLILLLKRRPLTFLHVFHHALVILMSFLWLESSQSLQVIALLTNTSVHMLMYSYYFLCSLGFRPPWKMLVTNCQIVQFVFSFAVSLVLLWLHFRGDGCAGMGSWTFNAFFNATLLLLFLNFHRQQYRVKKRVIKGKMQD